MSAKMRATLAHLVGVPVSRVRKWAIVGAGLCLLILPGCSLAPNPTVHPARSEWQGIDTFETYKAKEMGLQVEAPRNAAYAFASREMFGLMFHPLVKAPVTDVQYGLVFSMDLVPARQVAVLYTSGIAGKAHESTHDWASRLHPTMEVRADEASFWTHVRRDIVRTNGDAVIVRATVRQDRNESYRRDLRWATNIVGSVRPLEGE